MAVNTFAAIMIGSAETEMRIYEISARSGMKEIECISAKLNLGVDAYNEGELDAEKIRELVDVLREYRTIMDSYGVSGYQACATSALREIRTGVLVQDHVEKQTGLKIRIISNSEQRFLDYKSIACESSSFEEIIQKGTAIVDIGGNSMQISVFDKDKLFTTQNIRLGKISSREIYYPVAKNAKHYERMLTELLDHEMAGFNKLYQKERQIYNLIVVDRELMELIRRQYANGTGGIGQTGSDVFHIEADVFRSLYDEAVWLRPDEITEKYELAPDSAQRVIQSMIFCRRLLDLTEASTLWLMDVTICDGMCYDFGVSRKLIKPTHNFEDDIIAASRTIAKRYKCNQAHVRNLEELALEIFDRMKKIHGMTKRDRLLLRISVILHNCGKYISLANVADCAYNIIMATEIIGLSHDERRIIANVIRFNTAPFEYYGEISSLDPLNREEYLLIAKLTAILKVCNALDRSHKQKCTGAKIVLKDNELVITVVTQDDLSLEKITLKEQQHFFEEVFGVSPVLKLKKGNKS